MIKTLLKKKSVLLKKRAPFPIGNKEKKKEVNNV